MKSRRLADRTALCLGLTTAVWLSMATVCLAVDPPVSRSGQLASSKPSKTNRQPAIRYVQVEQAHVYAGPSDEYYPTGTIERGETIETYDQTNDGWLAIRPPQGSFSWLPAAQGLLLPGGRIVEVTENNAVAWIGSSLGTAKQYRWQVRLNRGEQLAVLGEQSIQDPGSQSKSLWYKIAPPNGEFRWIKLNATSDQPPRLVDEAISDELELANENSSNGNLPDADGQVIQASAEESIVESSPPRKPARKGSRSGSKPAAKDPWDNWHALEFKNGSFSFPGIARMFGMEPAPSTHGPRGPDPFDLSANVARPRSSQPNAASPSVDPSSDSADNRLVGRISRGWRDPRMLRNSPLPDSAVATTDMSQVDADVATYVPPSADMPSSVIDASLATDQPIGTSVVPASGPHSSDHTVETAGWFGIAQAPDATASRPSASGSDLSDLKLQLSEMVAGPEHTWNLAPLALRARHFIEHGSTAIERGEARLLLERIESFAKLTQTSLPLSGPAASAPAGQSALVAGSGPLSTQPRPDAANPNQFDATGWLVPVHSSGREMPTHALTNDAGKIIVYLTAAPGINLTRFESQQVGVYGLRGYLPQLKTNHVQVERTVRLR